jgi:hypothetical protein
MESTFIAEMYREYQGQRYDIEASGRDINPTKGWIPPGSLIADPLNRFERRASKRPESKSDVFGRGQLDV